MTKRRNRAVGNGAYFGWESSEPALSAAAVVAPHATPYPAAGEWSPLSDLGGAINFAFALTTATNLYPLPVIQCNDRHIECGQAWKLEAPQVIDGCCPNSATATIVGTPITNSPACPQIITVAWEYSNCQSGTATCIQIIFVERSNLAHSYS